MPHTTIRLKHEHPAHYIDALVKNNTAASDNAYDLLATDFCTFLKPNGEVLFKLLPQAMNLEYAVTAFHAFAGKKLGNVRDSGRPATKTSLNDGLEGSWALWTGCTDSTSLAPPH
jgi:hypothetical protein